MSENVYALRYLPPRANFPDTLTPAESAVIGKHFHYLKDFFDNGTVTFVGRCDNGAYGFALLKACDEAAAKALAANDPAVKAGIFKCEVERFLVILDR